MKYPDGDGADRGGAGPPGAGAAGCGRADRGRGQRPGNGEAVPGVADVGEPDEQCPGNALLWATTQLTRLRRRQAEVSKGLVIATMEEVSRQWVVDTLRRLGFQQEAGEALRVYPIRLTASRSRNDRAARDIP